MSQCQAEQHPSPRSSEGILAPLKPIASAERVRLESAKGSECLRRDARSARGRSAADLSCSAGLAGAGAGSAGIAEPPGEGFAEIDPPLVRCWATFHRAKREVRRTRPTRDAQQSFPRPPE